MLDQADRLRQLVNEAMPCANMDFTLRPTIVVTGGRTGVGATTVALNLAAMLSHAAHRTVLVDAASNAWATRLVGIEPRAGGCVGDIVAGACSASEALEPGPAGTLLLAGSRSPATAAERSPQACERLLRQLAALESAADTFVIDSDSGMTSWTAQLWKRAQLVIVVTTPDDMAVMGTYATIKCGTLSKAAPAIRVLVNRCDDASLAAGVERRLASSCKQFLGIDVGRAPRLPQHNADPDAGASSPAQGWEAPASPFGRALYQLGRFASDTLSQQRRPHGVPEVAFAQSREFSTC